MRPASVPTRPWGSLSSRARAHRTDSRAITDERVAAVSIDDFVREHATAVDLLRIDMPGFESAALAGMTSVVSAQHPDILLDLPPGARREQIGQPLSAAGYRLFVLDEEDCSLTPPSRHEEDDSLAARTYWCTARDEPHARAAIDESGIDLVWD